MKNNLSITGILNLQQVDNYGCVLGAYAMQEVTRRISLGGVEIIDYCPVLGRKSYIDKVHNALLRLRIYGLAGTCQKYKYILQMKHLKQSGNWSSEKQSEARAEKFEAFRKRFLERSPRQYTEITAENAPEYDIYLVGSDVVWFLDEVWNGQSPAFLAFTSGRMCRRISYAASLGYIPLEYGKRKSVRKLYREGLSHFDMVSVREEASVNYLAGLYPRKIYCCMDPTLLLSASDFEEIEKSAPVSTKKGYIYVYMLDDTGNFYETANRISKETGLPVVRNCDQINGYENVIEAAEGDGPAEFISRIKNADFVITNSFHAVCFSLIYHKDFYIVRRTTQAYKTEALLKKLELTDRYLDLSGGKKDFCAPIDYNSVDVRLQIWRSDSMDYLRKALSI